MGDKMFQIIVLSHPATLFTCHLIGSTETSVFNMSFLQYLEFLYEIYWLYIMRCSFICIQE